MFVVVDEVLKQFVFEVVDGIEGGFVEQVFFEAAPKAYESSVRRNDI